MANTFVTIIFLGLSSICLFRNPIASAYPLHASCKVSWTLSQDCKSVVATLAQQIETWKTNATCGSGQKCLYSLVSMKGNVLKATHTTPVRFYVDDLTFKFTKDSATDGCNVEGFSSSQVWYAVLDLGTNYCNLHNLVEGAGLKEDRLYSETTRDQICTQYTSANCEKY